MEIVPFHGHMLEAVQVGDIVWVSVRRMCEALGLDYSGQYQRLSDRARTPWAVVGIIPTTGPDGKKYETFCLNLKSVSMWLATVESSRVSEAIREKLVLFQVECADALDARFFKKPVLLSRTEVARQLLAECERADRGARARQRGQRQKLSNRERTPWTVACMTKATGPDGKNYQSFCLDLDSVPMWLATIDASRVAEASRPKRILFQKECVKVLRDHFFPKPVYPRPSPRRFALPRISKMSAALSRPRSRSSPPRGSSTTGSLSPLAWP